MDTAELTDFATRYAAVWSSQDPDALAAFYAEDGSLTVNAGAPSVGRAAIAAKARDFIAKGPRRKGAKVLGSVVIAAIRR